MDSFSAELKHFPDFDPPENHETLLSYDAYGHVVKQSQKVSNPGLGLNQQQVTLYQYDGNGQLVNVIGRDVSTALNSNAPLKTAHKINQYNAFGELTAQRVDIRQGVNGNLISSSEILKNDYDAAGHLWRSTQNGVTQIVLNDLNGRAVTTLKNRLVDYSKLASLADLGQLSGDAILRNDYEYDLMGHILVIRNPAHAVPDAGVQTPVIKQMVDRWGNVLSRTDARGESIKTLFTYNASNQVTSTRITAENAETVKHTAYDAAGRVVVEIDGNRNLNAKRYDQHDNVIQEVHADGGTISYKYNAFGNKIEQKTALDATRNQITRYGYNRLGLLTETRTEAVQVYHAKGDFGLATPVGAETVLALVAMLKVAVPDRATLSTLGTQSATPAGLLAVANQLLAQAGSNYPGSMSPTDFVTRVYQNAFNRVPLEGEINAAINIVSAAPLPVGSQTVLQIHSVLFDKGPTREVLETQANSVGTPDANYRLAKDLISGSGTLRTLSDTDFIKNLYDKGLKRVPGQEEIDSWLEIMGRSDRYTVALGFTNVSRDDNSDGATFNAKVNGLLAGYQQAQAFDRASFATNFIGRASEWNEDDWVPPRLGNVFKRKVDELLQLFLPKIGQGGTISIALDETRELVERNEYDDLNRLIKHVNAEGETSLTQYDADNNVIRVRNSFGKDTLSVFDNLHHKTREVDANGKIKQDIYLPSGQLKDHIDMGGRQTTNTYDFAGLLVEQVSNVAADRTVADFKPMHQTFEYSGGLLTRVTDLADAANPQITTYGYDLAGNRFKERTEKNGLVLQNNTIQFDYQNRIEKIQDGLFTVHYGYDGNSNRIYTITEYTDNKGNLVPGKALYSRYDQQNRAIVLNNEIDSADTVQYAANTHKITYDFAGNRTSDTYKGAHVIAVADNPEFFGIDPTIATTTESYKYDAAGRLLETWHDDVFQVDLRKYDAAGRAVRSGAYGLVSDDYKEREPSSPVILTNRGEILGWLGVAAEYRVNAYDQSHRIREKIFALGRSVEDGQGDLRDDIYYVEGINSGYDAVGNLVGYTVVAPTGGGQTVYHTDYRLGDSYQELKVTATTSQNTATTTSSYDANGNRIRLHEMLGSNDVSTRTIEYDSNHQALVKTEFINIDSKTTVTRNLIANNELIGNNADESKGDLANVYQSVNATSLTNAPSVYNAVGGETWQQIAKTVWGDSKLWYLIADANGASAITPGAPIKIPARINTVNNDA
ncbi:MAG: hypothetical protein RL748_61, partial [Pseudomonadota bacterium]